jgi:hypothetical protein
VKASDQGEARRVTQVQLSKKLGIPQQSVAQFETGDRELMLSR